MMRDRIVIALGNFMHHDRSLKECFLELGNFIGMGLVIAFLVFGVLG